MGWDFKTRREEPKTRYCLLCRKPIRIGLDAEVHTWCKEHRQETESVLPQIAENPIRPVEVTTMPKAKPAQLPATAASLHQSALEYLALKEEIERQTLKMQKLNSVLKNELQKVPGAELVVDDHTVLYVCPSISRSFDLETAKETLHDRELKKLEPYIKVTETLEVKEAEKFIDLSRFEKFISVKETLSLRTKDRKGD